MIPKSDSILVVDYELDGARAWSERHQVPLEWLPDILELRAIFTQPVTGEKFYLRGIFDNYREMPPLFTFCNSEWQPTNEKGLFPKHAQTRFGGSIFIEHNSKAVICVPFNRLAYADHAGPHSDWGNPIQWQTAAANYVRATTIGDMLQVIMRDIKCTNGRMT